MASRISVILKRLEVANFEGRLVRPEFRLVCSRAVMLLVVLCRRKHKPMAGLVPHL